MRKILATCGLPYANGAIHLGHMVEHVQADIWCRYQRLIGNEVYFVCGDDTHGTPIMVEARKRKITPEEMIRIAYEDHVKSFKGFQISHDIYSSTNTPENKELTEFFYHSLKNENLVQFAEIQQLYCNSDKMYLPDRFVKGTCPNCGALDQYGDSCDKCGATYTPADLKNPKCTLCGTQPVQKKTEQVMVQIEKYREYLKSWITEKLAPSSANKMMEWFSSELRPWDISRNHPYFGWLIPGYTDKYFYVWMDAPIGYLSATKEYCKKNSLSFDDIWKNESKFELYHFIGKDIVYFHSLFWACLLKASGFRSPNKVFVHGYLTVSSEKMSKSKGSSFTAESYLKHLDPTYLRYYYAAKLGSGPDDLDFSPEEFTSKVNSELIGKIVNLGSRGLQMLEKRFGSHLTDYDSEGEALVLKAKSASKQLEVFFEGRETGKAVSLIRELAEEGNRYFDLKAPWKTADSDPASTQKVITSTVNLFRLLMIYLKPIVPELSKNSESIFGESNLKWSDIQIDLKNKKISAFSSLLTRIEPEKVTLMMDENKPKTPTPEAAASTGVSEITMDDFAKVDLRVAEILSAESVEGADKLLRIKVSLGPLGEKQIFAGIKSAYDPKTLVGRKTIIVANLAPRKMKFGLSEGMILAAGAGGTDLYILSPDNGAKAGDKVK